MRSRSLCAFLIAAAVLTLTSSPGRADDGVLWLITYPPANAPQDGALGPGGARRVIVNLSSAAPNAKAGGSETQSLLGVKVVNSNPPGCGLPNPILDSATQFTLDWGTVCPLPGHAVIVYVSSTGPQGSASGSWRDAGNSQVSPAIVQRIGPAPALSPTSLGLLVTGLLFAGGLLARRRAASARA